MNLDEISLAFTRFQFKSDVQSRQRLWKKLSKLLHDGIPIIPALIEIKNLKKPTSPMAIAIDEWVRGMNNGRKISDVIQPWVSPEESMLLMAGEQSGTLDEALNSVVKVSKAKSEIQSALIGGLSYPFFLALMTFGIFYLFGYKIVPAFSKAARSDAWHGVAKMMIEVAGFVQNWLHWVAVLLGLLTVAFFLSLPRWNSRLRVALDRFAPYSIYRVMQGSSWLIALSALVQAGVRIESAIEQLENSSSAWGRLRMNAALKGLRSGRNLGDALNMSGYEFPDREIISDIRIYATKSGFDEALRLIGNEWITESVERIKMLMKVIFGISMLTVGLSIGFVVSGLLAMEMQLTELLQSGMR